LPTVRRNGAVAIKTRRHEPFPNKSVNYTITILLLSISFLQVSEAFQMPRISVTSKFVARHIGIVGEGKTVPVTPSYGPDGYNFLLDLSITTSTGSGFQDSLYGIVCIGPGYGNVKYFKHGAIGSVSDSPTRCPSICPEKVGLKYSWHLAMKCVTNSYLILRSLCPVIEKGFI
jgi:hypothetical protein